MKHIQNYKTNNTSRILQREYMSSSQNTPITFPNKQLTTITITNIYSNWNWKLVGFDHLRAHYT